MLGEEVDEKKSYERSTNRGPAADGPWRHGVSAVREPGGHQSRFLPSMLSFVA